MPNSIQIFSKPDCPYCQTAKAILTKAGLPFKAHDVTASERNADLSVFLSGVSTVPQIFIGDTHVNGASDLLALDRADLLLPLTSQASASLDFDRYSDQELHEGAQDFVLRSVIPEIDGSRSDNRNDWPILHMYKEFSDFGRTAFTTNITGLKLRTGSLCIATISGPLVAASKSSVRPSLMRLVMLPLKPMAATIAKCIQHPSTVTALPVMRLR